MKRAAIRTRSPRKFRNTFDRLEPRQLLAVLTGTEGDDVVSVVATGNTLEVDLNGNMQSFDFATDPVLEFDGLGGTDLVTLETTDGLPVEFVAGDLKVGVFTVDVANVETIDVANDGRIQFSGTGGDDEFVLTHSLSGSTVSLNGNEFELPITESALPLQIDADAGSDNLLLRMDDYSGGFLQLKLNSASRTDLIDSAWSGMEHVELEFLGSYTFFQLISDDVDDVLFVGSDHLSLEGSTTTFDTPRNLTATAFWHSGFESNQVFVEGTENVDVFEFSYEFGNQSVVVNDTHQVFLNNSSVSVDGKGGEDSVEFNLDEDSVAFVASALVEPNSITVADFPAVSLTNVESQAAGNMNEVTIADSAGDDHIEAFHRTVVSNVAGTTWTLTDNNSVDITSTGGHDSVVAFTSPEFNAPFYNYSGLGVSYQGNFGDRFLAVDFDDVTIKALDPGGFAYYGGDGVVDDFQVSDPDGNLLVELGDRVPVLFEGELSMRMQAFADDAKFNFTSAMEASEVQASEGEVVVNGNAIELVDIDFVEAIGNDPEDKMTLVGTPENDLIRSGVELGATERTTRLTSGSFEIYSAGFENILAVPGEGSDIIQTWGMEDVVETVEIGFQDFYSISMDGYHLVIDRGDFLTDQTVFAPMVYGYGPEDTLRFNGSPDHADVVGFSMVEEINGATVNEFYLHAELYDGFLTARSSSVNGTGFGKFEVDLAGGDFSSTYNLVVDWFAMRTVSADGEVDVWPGLGMASMSATDVSWQNITRLAVSGVGRGMIHDAGLDDTIVFGPDADVFFQNDIFPHNGMDVSNDELDARYAFDETIYFSTAGADMADLSVDANTLELGMNTTRATWEGVNLTLEGVEVVNASTENENDVATFAVDVDQLDVRVSDDRIVHFTSPLTGAVVNVATFDTININDDGSNVVSFLTDTTSNGTTTASVEEVLFTQIPDSDLSFPLVGVSRIELLAGTNTGELVVNGNDEDETLRLWENEYELVGQSYSILASSYPNSSVSGGDGNDIVALHSEFDSFTDDGALVFENANMIVRTTEFESSGTAPNLENILINDGASQRSSVNRLELTFAGSVEFDPGAFDVVQRSDGDGDVTGTPVSSDFTCTENGDTIVTLTFGSHTRNAVGDLEDGNYQLTIDGTKIRRAGTDVTLGGEVVYGDSADEPFYVLYGDHNGDRTVNVFDLLPFRQTYLASTGDDDFNAAMDYNADGVVNVLDLLQFRRNYRKMLPFV